MQSNSNEDNKVKNESKEVNMKKVNPEIFLKNVECLRIRYPKLADQVMKTRVENYTVFQQPNCGPNIWHNEIKRPWYTGTLDEHFDFNVKDQDLDNARVVVFLGIGLGYEIIHYTQKYSQKNKTVSIIIVERDIELFVAALNVLDLTMIIGHADVNIFVGLTPDNMYLEFRPFFQANGRETLLCAATKPIFMYMAFKLYKDYYIMALQRIQEAIWDNILNFGNCPDDSVVGLGNMLDNCNVIINNPGINLLKDKFKGKTAVIVATGPSLKNNMHLLKDISDKTVIIAVDASLKLLLENGIKPHMVTSLEREHLVQGFFDNIDAEEVKDVYMTTCPVLFNHVYESYNGPKIIAYRNFDHFKWLDIDRGILEIRLSASNMAFKIAEYMGCTTIVMIGQDLAYGDNGETHACEVPFSSAGEREFYTKGNIVDQIKTNDGWNMFKKAHELDVKEYQGRAVNSTEGGAYIIGTSVLPFAESINRYMDDDINVLDTIRESLSIFSEEDSQKDKEALMLKFEKSELEIPEIIKLCEDGVKVCTEYKDIINDDPETNEDELIKKYVEIIFGPRKVIQKDYTETFQLFLMHVLQAYHLKFEMQYSMKNDIKATLTGLHDWYAFVGDMSAICFDIMKKAKAKLCEDINIK